MLPPNTILQNRYRIVRLLKAGGMGEVYEAVDQRLNSTVALKLLTIPNPTPQLLHAFEREASLLGNLKHPALPRVSDHFNEQQSQFLVMEFVPGLDLDEILQAQGKPFSVNVVLRWADQLLDALEYLHGQNPPILHRDIKPQNLKVTARGQIMLLDFGLAKGSVGLHSVAASNHSIFGYTLAYAPLEQIQGVGTSERSDLYALGATLYHLLTNITPPDALSRASNQIYGQPDSLRPAHTINPAVPLAISTTLQDALALNANHRPVSAAAMRQSLQNASVVTPSSAVQPTIVPTITPMPPTIRVATPPVVAPTPSSAGQPTILPPVTPMPPTIRVATPPIVAPTPSSAGQPTIRVRHPAVRSVITPSNAHKVTILATLTGHNGAVNSVSWHPNGTQFTSSSNDRTARLWSADGAFIRELTGHTDVVHSVAWSADGAMVASASWDKTVRLWSADGTFIKALIGHRNAVISVAWSADGATLASASWDQTVRLWSADGKFIKELTGHTSAVDSVVWSLNGSMLASASLDNTVRLWNADGKFIKKLTGHTNYVSAVAWSPDSSMLASASFDNTVRLWSADGLFIKTLLGHSDAVISVAWSPDGATLASASSDGTVRLWNMK